MQICTLGVLMHLAKQKTIGFFISRISSEYQNMLINEFSKRAAEHGYYTLVYVAFGSYRDTDLFVRGERYMTQLPEYETFSGIVLAIDTFEEPVLEKQLLENIRARAKCPVVCVRREIEGYHSVLVDDNNSMECIAKHLIEDCGYKDFCYVSGPENHPDAIRRMECFLRVCEAHNIRIGMDSIYYGDFWRNHGEEIVSCLLDGRDSYPDAIVCANDYMAFSVSNALASRGIRVPDDIAVTGFDNLLEASAAVPPLTTVEMNVKGLAECAMTTLERLRNGEKVPMEQYIATSLVIRESCGSKAPKEDNINSNVHRHYEMYCKSKEHMHQIAFMSVDDSSVNDFDALNRVIYHYVFNNSRFRDFFIALCDYDWSKEDSSVMNGFTKRMHLRTVIQNNRFLGYVDHVYDKADLLTEEYLCENPCAYLIVPLHYRNRCLGYAMINFWENQIDSTFLQYFIMNISNTLENIRIRKKMGRLIDTLQEMYVSDALTNLSNRRGYEKQVGAMYETAVRENRSMALASIDMDGLKVINDTFGHAHGDIALKAIANAISSAGFSGEQFFRVGGDEFMVAALDYDERMMERYRERLEGFLADYNRRAKRPYMVQTSVGYIICDPADKHSLQEWMALCDQKMYDDKEKRRCNRKIIKEQN